VYAVAVHITPGALWTIAVEYAAAGLRLHRAARIPWAGEAHQSFAVLREPIDSWIAHLPISPTQLHLALSPEFATLVHSFPVENTPSQDQLAAIVEFELQQFLTTYDRQRYVTFVLPLRVNGEMKEAVAITYARADIEQLHALCQPELLTTTILPDWFSLPAFWRYTYPELADRSAVLLNLQPPYIDVLFLVHGKIALFRTLPAPDSSPEALAQQCASIFSSYRSFLSPPAEALFIFGQALHRSLIDLLQANFTSTGNAPILKRLNAFRMYLPPSDERMCHYAIRTAHLFWACTGVCLPPEESILKL